VPGKNEDAAISDQLSSTTNSNKQLKYFKSMVPRREPEFTDQSDNDDKRKQQYAHSEAASQEDVTAFVSDISSPISSPDGVIGLTVRIPPRFQLRQAFSEDPFLKVYSKLGGIIAE